MFWQSVVWHGLRANLPFCKLHISGLIKGDYTKFGLENQNVDYWIGEFKLDNTGKLTFKFANKKIVPNWAKDPNVQNILI